MGKAKTRFTWVTTMFPLAAVIESCYGTITWEKWLEKESQRLLNVGDRVQIIRRNDCGGLARPVSAQAKRRALKKVHRA